jgi:hypothetical protein
MRLPARLISALPLATAITLSGAPGQGVPASCIEPGRAVSPATLPAPALETIRRQASGAPFEALERVSSDGDRSYEAFFDTGSGGLSVVVLPDGTLIDRRARACP